MPALFSSRNLPIAPFALILALAACDERNLTTPPPGAVASTLRVTGGDGQSGVAGAALPDEIAVAVLDAAGKGIPGFTVRFAAVSGGGQLGAETATSDADGVARTTWTLGTVAADSQVVEARLEGTPSVRLRAQARAAAPAGLTVVAGNGAAGPVGAVLADSLVVTVKDRFGNPVVGLEVAWAAAAGGGALSPARTATRADGSARAAWTLGPRVDSAQVAVARVAGLDSVAFTASAVTAGAPLRLAKRGGDVQRGAAGSVLADSLGVSLLMPDGRPVAGALVTWSVPPQAGTVTPVVSRTDANGAASTVWRLGSTPGVAQATATVDGGTLIFTSVIGADAPAQVAAASGTSGAGGVGQALADSLAVRVTDRFGNPVPNAAVDWSALTGGGAVSPARSTTGADGIARAQWTLGPAAGTPQSARALVAGLDPIGFSATATTEGVPLRLAKRGGDGQRGTAGALLADSLGVSLRMPDGRPVAGALVTWSVPAQAGTVTPATSRTDANGAAAAVWRLGSTPGVAQATATVDGGTLIFTSAIEADAPAAVAAVAGGGEGRVGGALADSLAVRVTDQYGNPVPNAAVDWSVQAGGGAVSPVRSTTDAQGIARAQWTLGWRVGAAHTASATVGTLPSVGFQATASTDGVTLQLARVGGNGQTGEAGAALADSLAVRLTSPSGVPVQGAVVRWAVASGGGSVSAASTPTDAQGMAAVRWTLGTGTGAMQATATLDAGVISFAATATAGAPATVRTVGGNAQSTTRGTILADSLEARVEDRHGNPLASQWVRWSVAAGGGRVEADSSLTDAQGVARVRWAVGLAAGTSQRVTAALPGKPGVQFTSTATAGALTLTRINGTLRSGFGSSSFRSIQDTLRVRVTGPGGQPVVGALVRWELYEDGYDAVRPAQTLTDWNGFAKRWWDVFFEIYSPAEPPIMNAVFEGQNALFDDAELELWYEFSILSFEARDGPPDGYVAGDTASVELHIQDIHYRSMPRRMTVTFTDDNGWSGMGVVGPLDEAVGDVDVSVQWPLGSKIGERTLTVLIEHPNTWDVTGSMTLVVKVP